MDMVNETPWYFRVEPDTARLRGKGIQSWWQAGPRGPRRGSARASRWAGYGWPLVNHPRDQRVMMKIDVAVSGEGNAWYKHGGYLQREGAQREGQGVGFDAHGNPIRMSATLAAWQRAGDGHLFKIMLSPDHAERLNLMQWTQDVMRAIEKDLERPLQWLAIDHHNTGHAHVHVCVRGVDRHGQELQIAKDYLQQGVRYRARDVLTQKLGWKLAPEWERIQARAIFYRGYGQHDRSLMRKLDDDRTVPEQALSPRERERLTVLAQWGLAWPTETGWQVAFQWKEKLRMEREREYSQEAPQRERTRQKEERGRDPQEKEREEQERRQRTVRIIDELEQERGR